MTALEAAKHARDGIVARYVESPWFRGAGLDHDGQTWRIIVHIARDDDAQPDVPNRLDGIEVRCVAEEEFRAT